MAYVLRIKPILNKLSIQFSKHLEALEVQFATDKETFSTVSSRFISNPASSKGTSLRFKTRKKLGALIHLGPRKWGLRWCMSKPSDCDRGYSFSFEEKCLGVKF